MEAYRDAGRRVAASHTGEQLYDLLRGATVYTTMMPCEMCAGAIIRFGAARVVVAELVTYADSGTRPLMENQGIAVEVHAEADCIALVEAHYRDHPEDRVAWSTPRARPLKF